MANKTFVKRALQSLSPMVSEARRSKIASVVPSRTRSFGILLENVHDKGNENAVARTMDAFGVLCMHRLTTVPPVANEKVERIRTDAGAKQWLEILDWSNLEDCVHMLKDNGYMIASTSPNCSLDIVDIDFSKKMVVAFGNEQKGISEGLAKFSDLQFSLPMKGFVESFNVSVCVAITLYHAYCHRIGKMVSFVDCMCTVPHNCYTGSQWLPYRRGTGHTYIVILHEKLGHYRTKYTPLF